MQITFERTGGVAGARLKTRLDDSLLSPSEMQQLQSLIEESGFFDLPAVIASAVPRPDAFHYRLTIQDEQQQHTVVVSEPNVPARLQPLLQFLARASRGQGPQGRGT